MIKSNPNKGTNKSEYDSINYQSSGVYECVCIPTAIILVSKKHNLCLHVAKDMFEDAIDSYTTESSVHTQGFSIEDVLKLIVIKSNSANIEDIIK